MRKFFLFFIFFLFVCNHKEGGEYVEVSIKKGMTGEKVGYLLKKNGIIKNVFLFKLLLKYYGENKIKAGTYLLRKNMEEKDVVVLLLKGPNYVIKVTIPEGYTVKDIARLLYGKGVIRDTGRFLHICNDRKIVRRYGFNFPSLEGLLFPDTYIFYKDTDEMEVVERMVDRFMEMKERAAKGSNIPDSIAIIIASLVEKEAAVDEERPVIAGIFYNRLKKGMKLESCATVEYILPEHKKRLTYRDLKLDNPYNTYIYYGLPPGPICNPGFASLRAAYFPKNTDYLYFVSKGDGTHAFARTSKEHAINKKKYRR